MRHLDHDDRIGPGESSAAEVDPFHAVLEAARNGDGRAFGLLYEKLNRRVQAFARVRGANDPEGLVNDVFLQVFTGLRSFRGNESQFNAWVFTIARNRLIDEARRRSRRPVEVAAETTALTVPIGPDDVEQEVEARLATESMLAQLDVLTDEQRDVVLLRIVSDLTIDTIAEIIGKRPGAVKALQRRAFRALARDLATEVVPL